MDNATRKALVDSIDAWKKKRDATEYGSIRIRTDSCALCSLYYDQGDKTCGNCPVAMRTGENSCRKTPWSNAQGALTRVWFTRDDESVAAWRSAAQAMVDFLESLLPPDMENGWEVSLERKRVREHLAQLGNDVMLVDIVQVAIDIAMDRAAYLTHDTPESMRKRITQTLIENLTP